MKSIFTILILLSSVAAMAQLSVDRFPGNKVLLKGDMYVVNNMAFFDVTNLANMGDRVGVDETYYVFSIQTVTPSITSYLCMNCADISKAKSSYSYFVSLFGTDKLIASDLEKGYIFNNERLLFFNLPLPQYNQQ